MLEGGEHKQVLELFLFAEDVRQQLHKTGGGCLGSSGMPWVGRSRSGATVIRLWVGVSGLSHVGLPAIMHQDIEHNMGPLLYGLEWCPSFLELDRGSTSQRVQVPNIEGLWSQIPLRVWLLGSKTSNIGYLDPLGLLLQPRSVRPE